MKFLESIAKKIAPSLKSEDEIKGMIAEEIRRARMNLPIAANYDPKNDGYRRYSDSVLNRNLTPVQQSRMYEIAYYMWDASAMFKRLAKLDRSFLFSGRVTIASEDEDVQKLINKFWYDKENLMDIRYPDKAMWLSILGDQLWPVDVNPHTGFVRLRYIDPAQIREVYINAENHEQVLRVELMGLSGKPGKIYNAVRKDQNIYSKSFDRLTGECFYLSINHPPNAPRGRSDFLTLFDWIDSLERYGYNYLERAELLLNFVWDITLEGADETQIREFLRNNPPPAPGSMRAHNQSVKWEAVSPELKATDFTGGFNMGKEFIMGAAGRPDSWFGAGGKAYQTEAEQMNQVPIADLEERQEYHRYNIETLIQFVIDQAVIHGTLPAEKAEAGFSVIIPPISKKDTAKMIATIPQLAAALVMAENQQWIRKETATRMFSFAAENVGFEINPDEEIEAAKNAPKEEEIDYDRALKEKENDAARV
jgi:hypothetical protein